VLGSYAFRAAGDALGTPDLERLTLAPAWPSMLSPIGWGQQTMAFTENDWAPVAWISALAAAALAAALAVHARRDLGASLLPERSGRAAARPGLGSPIGLAWRLQAPTLLAWAVGSALLGLALGSLVTAIAGADIDNPAVEAVIASLGHTQGDLAEALIPALMVIVGVLSAAAGVQAVLRMREEEGDGRAEAVLTTSRSRHGWLLAFTAVGALSVLIVLLATGLATAAGFLALDDPERAWLAFGQTMVQAPGALTFVGAAALLVGLVPRAAIALGWGAFAIGVGIGLFGDLLGLPDEVIDASPVSNAPTLPTDDWVPTIVLAAVAVGLAVLAALAFRRRDLVT
jgi:ABC-2 type transport system permease protein